MGKVNASLLSFNRGEVSKYALARVDLEKLRLAAETQVNWMPTVLGPMMLRPGLQYVGGVNDDLACRLLPFIFANDDLALLELTNLTLRVWNISGTTETLVTRPAVSTTVTSGSFASTTGWTLTTTGSGSVASITGGALTLACPTAGGVASAKQTVSVAVADRNVEHAFRIVVTRGPVRFRAGSADELDDFISETTLDTGTHSIACTPTGDIYIKLDTITAQSKIVDSITIEASGVVELPTPWTQALLPLVRREQSGDIVYIACYGLQQRKIERRSTRSWSVVLYQAPDGPFQNPNITDITLTPGALTGNTTLTASRALFKTTHVGALFRLFSVGQTVTASIATQNTFTSTIRVTGTEGGRTFNYAITGLSGTSSTVTLQRSLDSATSGFTDVLNFTADTSSTYNDGLDNSIAWYKIGVKTGNYSSGTIVPTLSYAGGGAPGVGRVTDYSSSTVVNIEILAAFGSTSATDNWNEGDWSDKVGWPSAVSFFDGRLWWAGRDKIWGSVSDAYTSFDIDYAGDAGPINRSVGFGPVDTINWLLPLSRLIVGRQGAETSIRSSAFDEPLTPTNFSLKDCSTQGSEAIGAVKIDTRGVFIQQSGKRVYELSYNAEGQDYSSHDLTRLNPDIGIDGFVDLAAQRQPDTQMHFPRTDGQSAILMHDVDDGVEAWWRIDTDCDVDGEIEAVCVLPGTIEDRVYYAVSRTIGGQTKRFIEKMARQDQCRGQPEARCADAHVYYSGVATGTITGLSHLEGQSVVVWGWNTSSPFTATLPNGDVVTIGKDLGTYTVSGGQITGLTSDVTNACVGLAYTAQFKSAKLAYGAQMGTAVNQTKKIDHIGLVLYDTHCGGLTHGQSFTTMDDLPLVEEGATLDTNTVWPEYDQVMIELPGEWSTDARLCLQAASPRPCTVAGVVVAVSTNEG